MTRDQQQTRTGSGLVRRALPPPRVRLRHPFAWIAVVAVVSSIAGGAVVSVFGRTTERAAGPAPRTAPGPAIASWAGVARRAARGVVEVTVTRTIHFDAREGVPAESESESVFGTGFVIDRRGSIVTNEHVIEGGGTISIHLADGTVAPASLIGSDASTDLAVMRVQVAPSHLHPLRLGSSDSLELGAPVLAIGTPFGYRGSVSAGVVSAFGREIESPSGYTIGDAIQTDAAVNHGNSGGPLLGASARVVGINAQIAANSGVNGNVGVAFAIPVDDNTRRVITQLASTGVALHAWLGAAGVTLTAAAAKAVGMPNVRGVAITGIAPGSPAALAGLEPGSRVVHVAGEAFCGAGDVLTSIGDARIETAAALRRTLQRYTPGSTVEVGFVHANGTPAWRLVKLVEQPARPPQLVANC